MICEFKDDCACTIEHPRFAGKNKKKAMIQIQNNASVDDQNALRTLS